jgi:cytochrome P450
MLLYVLIVTLTSIAYVSVKRVLNRRRFTRTHGCQPVTHSLNKEPFFGIDALIPGLRARSQHKILERGCELFRDYGNTWTLRELFLDAIITVEPENIKTILSLKFQDYGIAYRLGAFKPLLGEGIFDTDGEKWASSRALIRPSFTRDQIADLTSLESLMQDLFALLPRDGRTIVDLQDLFFRYTMDSATEFLFGQSVGSLKNDSSEPNFAYAFQYAQEAIMKRGMLGPLNILFRDRKADECNRICRDFTRRFVEDAIHAVELEKRVEGDSEAGKRRKVIFSHELASRTSDSERILDELMNMLVAGRDTTASLLSNLFFVLAKNPTIWEKLRSEVAVLNGCAPTYEELQNFKYVKGCVNECKCCLALLHSPATSSQLTVVALRLYPVVPRNNRMAIRDTVLPLGGGPDGLQPVFVPKGTIAGYNLYAMHRRKDIYGPDAEDFRPERWLDGTLQPRWGFLPFNGGPRICIGQRFALTEVEYVVVRMVQEFRTLESRDSGPWEESLTLTLCSRNGTKVSLTAA